MGIRDRGTWGTTKNTGGRIQFAERSRVKKGRQLPIQTAAKKKRRRLLLDFATEEH